jgi:hypothetical protein
VKEAWRLCDLGWRLRISERRNAGKPLLLTQKETGPVRELLFALGKKILLSLELFRKCAMVQLVEVLFKKPEGLPGMCPGG